MKRKEFLKLSSIGVTGLLFSNPLIGSAFEAYEVNDGSSFEVLIIGTGYGASVAALRLAEAGKRCLLLEMGMDWKKSGVPFSKMGWAEKQSTWLKTTTIAPFGNYRLFSKFTGALDRIDFNNVKVYAGRGIGGGSLVNGGMAVTPKKEYFQEVFPELNARDFYNTYFPLANKELGVSNIPETYYNRSRYYQYSRVGEMEAKKAGYQTVKVPNIYDFDYMQKEEAGTVTKSALDGEVIYGNNHGKKDLTKTYLKKAIETGLVSILPLHKVEQISQNSDNTYSLSVNELNTSGNVIQTKTFTTSKLILGAGSIGTTELLLKSKAKGTLQNLDGETGKYWGNNGNVMTGRNFLSTGTGITQSTIPSAGIDAWNSTLDAFFAEIAPFPTGMETWAALYLVINKVPSYGSFRYNTRTEKLELDWGYTQTRHMITNTQNFVNRMNRYNGGIIASGLFTNGIGADICYHPLGGCVLGKATDVYGRVNGLPGLYVVDGSLIPASIGVNPFVTITALAEYCMENIIKNDFKTPIEETYPNINTYPSLFKNSLTISFDSNLQQSAEIEILNSHNYPVKKVTIEAIKGTNEYILNGLWWLTPGVYFIKITLGDNEYIKKITK